jgi:dTDP-4-amino-4,6-dideoxygalactose transaminase
MKIARTIPPAAVPTHFRDILAGLRGLRRGVTEIAKFREEIRRATRCRHCFLVSSGQAALFLILRALKTISPDRSDVVIPAFTCYSVPAAILRAGLTIRPCDIDPVTLGFDGSAWQNLIANYDHSTVSGKGKSAILPPPLAVVPTYLFGLHPDLDGPLGLKQQLQSTIIADAAQMFPFPGLPTPLDDVADIVFYSLGRGKAFSTVEGGVIITNDDKLAKTLAGAVHRLPEMGFGHIMRMVVYSFALMCFTPPNMFWIPKALPFLRLGETVFNPDFPVRRFSAFQAGLACRWQTKRAHSRSHRQRNTRYWESCLIEAGFAKCMRSNIQETELIRYPLRVADPAQRAFILNRSNTLGLGIMPSYPTSICRIPELSPMLEKVECPQADRVTNELITLPVHEYLTQRDRIQIQNVLKVSSVDKAVKS